MHTHTLSQPIKISDNESITSVDLRSPGLSHIAKFIIAIGPDVISILAAREQSKVNMQEEPDSDDQSLPPKVLKELLHAVIKEERFDRLINALASYLSLTEEQAGEIGAGDIIEIGKKVSGFFPEIFETIKVNS